MKIPKKMFPGTRAQRRRTGGKRRCHAGAQRDEAHAIRQQHMRTCCGRCTSEPKRRSARKSAAPHSAATASADARKYGTTVRPCAASPRPGAITPATADNSMTNNKRIRPSFPLFTVCNAKIVQQFAPPAGITENPLIFIPRFLAIPHLHAGRNPNPASAARR